MEAWLGFHQLVVPRHGFRERPVRVLWTPMTGRMVSDAVADLPGLKRQLIWTNPIRNRRLARLARALAGGDRATLGLFLSPAAGVPEVPGGGHVLVLVENVEHALRLAEALPGWPLLLDREVNPSGLSPGQVQCLASRRCQGNELPAQGIVTASRIMSLSLSPLDVLVRGDGGPGLPPLPSDSLLQRVQQAPRPLFLVDCDDRIHPQFRRHTRRRQRAYAQKGWLAPGVDPVAAAVERFLASRQPADEEDVP
jgi:hypothetical protein